MGIPHHAVEAINNGADAVAAAYIFHFSQYTPNDIKKELINNNILARGINI
jgi:cyclase